MEIGVLHEVMSGSSPWYSVPGPDGPLQVMSGATIRDRRDQVDLSVSRVSNDWTHRIAGGYSVEDDYQALYASLGSERRSRDGSRSYDWGVSYSNDLVMPTDAEQYGRVASAERDALSASFSFTQVLNRNAVLQSGIALTRQEGFLSDPYKLVWIDRAVLPDTRPERRVMFAWTTRFRQYLPATRGALVLDYRFFRDDWDIEASTLEAAWKQPVGANWEVAPSLRYHTQSAPDFFAPYFFEAPLDGYWSSDYRLSTFGALSYRLGVNYRAEKWLISANAEYYDSKASWALSSAQNAAPGLVDFWRISAALRYDF
jgi:hypothetical protein